MIPWSALGRLIRIENQTGTLLLLCPTLWALVLAEQNLPSLRLLLIFSTGAWLMRSAGVILNDLADRSFDRHVARTKTRPLASGELRPSAAWILLAVLLLLAGGLVMMLNRLVVLLAPVAVLLATLYPFAKRILHVPQAVLGIAFGWGAVMAWAAVHERIDTPAWCVFGATIAWAVAYDTIYALQDRVDDQRIGVKSAALFFGTHTWLAVGTALTLMVALLGTAGRLTHAGAAYYGVLFGVGVFFCWQTVRLRQPVEAVQAFHMFQAHVWAGLAILTGLVAGFLL